MIDADLSPLANHLWQSTLCVGVAWVLSLALSKNRAAVRYWIWMAASVKFLVPFALLVGVGHQLGWPAAPAGRQPFPVVIAGISQPFVPPVASPHPPGAPAAPGNLPEILLLGIWLSGFAVGLIFWWRWWLRIRMALRSATPVHLNLPIAVMSSRARLEPGVFGIRRPILLLPETITDHLEPAQLQAVLAHELCHVRRRDNLTAAIHMVVEAIFWFHPLVWWIRTRLVDERERACDEAVLNTVSDAKVYAEGILNVCKFYLALPLVSAAGVTGSNLKRRIEEIMANRKARNLDLTRRLLLVTAGLTVVAAPVVIGMMDARPLRAQSPPAEKLSFAVASIKQNTSDDNNPRNYPEFQFLPGGRLVVRNMPLLMIIASAYNLPFQSDRLTGGPEWIRGDRYDIEATAEEGAIPAGATVMVRDNKMRLMIQSLLADRFKMVLRREINERQVYAVVVRKGGPKLQKAAREEKDCTGSTGLGFADSCHSFQGGQGRGLHAGAATITDIALAVSNWADRPVVDKTGLTGLYKIETDGWVPMRPRPSHPPGEEPSPEDRAMADPARPTLFQIFDRLGLKLESQRAPVETFAIESIARPSAN